MTDYFSTLGREQILQEHEAEKQEILNKMTEYENRLVSITHSAEECHVRLADIEAKLKKYKVTNKRKYKEAKKLSKAERIRLIEMRMATQPSATKFVGGAGGFVRRSTRRGAGIPPQNRLTYRFNQGQLSVEGSANSREREIRAMFDKHRKDAKDKRKEAEQLATNGYYKSGNTKIKINIKLLKNKSESVRLEIISLLQERRRCRRECKQFDNEIKSIKHSMGNLTQELKKVVEMIGILREEGTNTMLNFIHGPPTAHGRKKNIG
tara:strand:+ start:224 stop:1018 length:795 start_codon:yes stop_codon:yes gene_type:complete